MDAWTPAWWHWMILAAMLLALEVAIPSGLALLLAGAAAALTASLKMTGLHMPLWADLAIFATLATVLLMGFRKPLQRRIHKPPIPEEPEAS